MGRRQAKTVSGTSTQFLYDGLNPIQEKSGSTVTASLLTGLGIDEFLARAEGANTQHFLTDALASTVRLTNDSAAKIVDYTYEPYGKASADAASTNAFQYTGRENDGTGLSYYRARYQHPVLGRFISEDPIGLAGGSNLYSYVHGAPTLYSDPYGLKNLRPQPPQPSTRDYVRHPELLRPPVVRPANSLTRQEQLELWERAKAASDMLKEYQKQELRDWMREQHGIDTPRWRLPEKERQSCTVICPPRDPTMCRPSDGQCRVVCGPTIGPY